MGDQVEWKMTSEAMMPSGKSTIVKDLFVVSVTINVMVVLIYVAEVVVRLSWKYIKSKRKHYQEKDEDDFMRKNAADIGAIIADGLVTLAMLAGSFYLIIGVQLLQYPTLELPSHSVNITTIILSITNGRVIVVIVMNFRRRSTPVKPLSSGGMAMMIIENGIMVLALTIVLYRRDDLVTGAYLTMMCADNPVFTMRVLLEKLKPDKLNRLRMGLLITQCFLSLAFRFTVPFVCTILYYSLFKRSFQELDASSMVLYVTLVIFYASFNIYRIVVGIKDLSTSCQEKSDTNNDIANTKQAYFINNTPNSFQKKIPLKIHFSSNDIGYGINSPVKNTRTDLNSYLDANLSPARGQVLKPSNQMFLDTELNVPNSGSNHNLPDAIGPLFKPCSNVNLYCSTSSSSNEPVRQNQVRKSYSKQPIVETPLPTIQEETDSFSDIPL